MDVVTESASLPSLTTAVLGESEIPTHWYNIVADFPHPPAAAPAPRHPAAAGQPADLAALFPTGLIEQEVSTERWIEIPQPVRDIYKLWRPAPMHRAHRLEQALGTTARIYYKYEGVSPVGSHKTNSAVPQAYYNMLDGRTRLTTETGAGQWGSALAFATQIFGLSCEVWQVRGTYESKPYRRLLMETFGATVTPSPSDRTESGRAMRERFPDTAGSLGMAISEAIEEAAKDPRRLLLPGVGAQPRGAAPDASSVWRPSSNWPCSASGCPTTCSPAPAEARTWPASASPSCARTSRDARTSQVVACEPKAAPSLTEGEYTLRLRRHRPQHAAAEDVHPGPRLRARPRARRRPALPRHGPAGQPRLPRGADERDRRSGRPRRSRPGVLFARAEGIVPASESNHAIAGALRAGPPGRPRTAPRRSS